MTQATGNAVGREADAGSLSRAGELFQLLRHGKARTRAELALSTGLARSTVASRIDALMQSGLVVPAGEAVSSGGRPPSRFAFNPSARLVLAVDVGATHVVVAMTDFGGKILAEQRLSQQVADGPETVLGRIVTLGKGVLGEAGRSRAQRRGAGRHRHRPAGAGARKPAGHPACSFAGRHRGHAGRHCNRRIAT